METSQTQLEQRTQHDLKKPTQNTSTCTICLNNLPQTSFYTFGCNHSFCEGCLKSHIHEQLMMFQMIVCPQEECQHPIDHSMQSIYHQLDDREKRKIDTILSNFKRMITIKKCKKCKEGLLVESLKEQQAIYFCDHCRAKHCYNCCKPIHPGRRECVSQEQTELPPNCQQCRKCLSVVQKIQGCSHIRCWCGFDFCYECGYHWDKSHICEYKLLRRQGMSRYCCCLVKLLLFVSFILPAIIIFIFIATLFVCLLSAMMGGVFFWSHLMTGYFKVANGKVGDAEVKASDPGDSQCCKLIVLVFGLLALPLFIVLVGVVTFFLPFINLCYERKFLLSPTVLKEIFQEIQRWVELLIVI